MLGANLYVQSKGPQQQIRQRLTAVLGLPVEVSRAVFTPWGGLRIDGIRIVGIDARPVMRAETFQMRVSLLDLLRGRITVTGLTLENPEVTLAQDAEGRWLWQKVQPSLDAMVFPGLDETAGPSPPPGATPSSAETASGTPAPGGTAAPTPATRGAGPRPTFPAVATPPPAGKAPSSRVHPALLTFPPGFERVELQHANITFLDRNGRRVAVLEDVNLTLAPLAGGAATDFSGRILLARATFDDDRIRVTDFSSSVKFAGGVARMPDGTGKVAAGRLEAAFTIRPTDPGSPYELDARIEGVSLSKLAEEADADPEFATGKLEGTLHLTGLGADPEARQGEGKLRLLDGKFRRTGLLKTFGDRSNIEELRNPEFKLATLDYTVAGRVVTAGPLELASANLRVVARGTCLMPKGELDLGARLVLAPGIARQIPVLLASNFIASPDVPGERYIDFKIGGTLGNPSTDLFTKTLSQPVQSVLSRFFGRKKKPEEERVDAEPSPSPSPRSP